jgi:hypothetical protein
MSEVQAKKNTGLIAGIIAGAVTIVAAIVVILVIVLNSGTSLIGKWSITGAREGDGEVSMDLLKSLGMNNYTIEFKDGGKGTMNTGTGEHEFTYDKDKKTINADGETIEYKIDGKELSLTQDGFTMFFEK